MKKYSARLCLAFFIRCNTSFQRIKSSKCESTLRVKADTTIDSFGFCLSVILKNEDLANTVIVIDNQTTYKNLSRFCHDKLFLLNCRLNADDDVIPGNRIVAYH